MIINQMALKRQATVLALLVIIVVAGLYSYATLPRESFPETRIDFLRLEIHSITPGFNILERKTHAP